MSEPTVNDSDEAPLDAQHYYDALDRADVMNGILAETIGKLAVVERDPRAQALYEKAEAALGDLYQGLGGLYADKEDEAPKTAEHTVDQVSHLVRSLSRKAAIETATAVLNIIEGGLPLLPHIGHLVPLYEEEEMRLRLRRVRDNYSRLDDRRAPR